jgi:uncharacterized protein YggU (UPF0235/DUF167 family)
MWGDAPVGQKRLRICIMHITVTVKPGKTKDAVEVLKDGTFVVSLTARPIEGLANKALQKILAKHFGTAPSCVIIKKGGTSRKKVVEILV